jgi:hypothetical protein
MALFYKCGPRKLIAGFPCLLATLLILYISYIFMFEFLPFHFPKITFASILVKLSFTYFSIMTILSILKTAVSDPGYLSEDLRHLKGDEPYKTLRVHNMKMFTRLNLYDFSKVQRIDEESQMLA